MKDKKIVSLQTLRIASLFIINNTNTWITAVTKLHKSVSVEFISNSAHKQDNMDLQKLQIAEEISLNFGLNNFTKKK